MKIALVFFMFFSLGATLTMIACKRMKRKFDADDDTDIYGNYKNFGI